MLAHKRHQISRTQSRWVYTVCTLLNEWINAASWDLFRVFYYSLRFPHSTTTEISLVCSTSCWLPQQLQVCIILISLRNLSNQIKTGVNDCTELKTLTCQSVCQNSRWQFQSHHQQTLKFILTWSYLWRCGSGLLWVKQSINSFMCNND